MRRKRPTADEEPGPASAPDEEAAEKSQAEPSPYSQAEDRRAVPEGVGRDGRGDQRAAWDSSEEGPAQAVPSSSRDHSLEILVFPPTILL